MYKILGQDFKACKSCFFTTKFPRVVIGEDGQCTFCKTLEFPEKKRAQTKSNLEELKRVAKKIKADRKGKYDCLVGASGGLDSSYVIYVAKSLLDLNPLVVKYDHGFNYEVADKNLETLCNSLGVDLRIYKSSGNFDMKYVKEMILALRPMGLYWGICKFCHFILPCVAYREAVNEKINYVLISSNLYEEHLKVPFQHKLKHMLKAMARIMPWDYLKVVYHNLKAQYYLIRLKLEYYLPPAFNLTPMSEFPKNPGLELVNITDYVEWDIHKMVSELQEKTGWRPPEQPNLPMRFDCMIENSYINATFEKVVGLTVHGIICNNLLHDEVFCREEMAQAIKNYSNDIKPVTKYIDNKLGIES